METLVIEQSPTAIKSTNHSSPSACVQERVEAHMPLVCKIVLGIHRTLPSHIDVDDLMSLGSIGLFNAARQYNPQEGSSFQSYAALRIRGAVLDELRRQDPLARTARAKARLWESAWEELNQKLGREPSEGEMAERLGLTAREYRRLRKHIETVQVVSLDAPLERANDSSGVGLHDLIADDSITSVSGSMEATERSEALYDALQCLPERQQKVLAMLYFENLRLGEVAHLFGVSEARICQLRNQAFNHLRRALKEKEAAA